MLSRRRIVYLALAAFLIVLIVAIISGNEAETPATPEEPTATLEGTATPTVEEVLQEFVLCNSLRVNLYTDWGQAPHTITSDDPSISGELEPGDYIRLLMPRPDEERRMRVEVYPHDGRAVGRTDNMVWISWYGFYASRTEHVAFTCED